MKTTLNFLVAYDCSATDTGWLRKEVGLPPLQDSVSEAPRVPATKGHDLGYLPYLKPKKSRSKRVS